jgi:hypothetical protein
MAGRSRRQRPEPLRSTIIAAKVRPGEKALLEQAAQDHGAQNVSELIRRALDSFLGTELAQGDLRFTGSREPVHCGNRRCGRLTERVFGPRAVCWKCHRQAGKQTAEA